MSDLQLQNARILILIPNFIMLATTMSVNEFKWIPIFFTFWGYFISMFSVFATMKAATYYEWQIVACVSTTVGQALNNIIMPLFWFLLYPSYQPMVWNIHTFQMNMHLITLHSVPFISTTLNVALTDMKLLRGDVVKVVIAGYIYVACNIFGQFMYGFPIYPGFT